ncbi:MAG: hypothetical protein VXW91_01660 [Pseudomonadota bacterium]|nr:hypothetical protein [Pseudomonadota bacterium]
MPVEKGKPIMTVRMSLKSMAINLSLAFAAGAVAHASYQSFFGAGGDPVTRCGSEDDMAQTILDMSEEFASANYHTETGKGDDAYVTYYGGGRTMVAAHYPDGHVCVTLGK